MPDQFVALDLETTGLNPDVDQITEIGAVRFTRQGGGETFQTLVRPNRAIPAEIEELTGITNEQVAAAPRFDEVASELASFVGDLPIVGQNISFDRAFLARAGVDFPGVSYDTWEISSVLLPRASRLNLGSLARLLGVDLGNAHRALADAEATRDVFLALLGRFETMPPSLLLELRGFAATSGWAVADLIAEAIDRARPVGRAPDPDEAARIAERLRQPLPSRVAEPLEPRENRLDVRPDQVMAVFAEAEQRSDLFPGYETRRGQLEMAAAVAEHLSRGGQLAVEAGTGTGKSLGYLVPAALHARANHDRVVVSTHTLNLQDQLAQHDLPLAARLIEATTGEEAEGLRVVVQKGRSNYLCLERWSEARLEGQPRDEAEARLFGRIANWLPTTATGDLSELYMTSAERSSWDRLSAEGTDCLQRRCPFVQDGRCFVVRSRQRAAAAHVVVVNHALLLANAARGDSLLPEFNQLIIDEAHRLEDVATQQFGGAFDARAIRDLFELAGPNERHGEPGLVWRLRHGQGVGEGGSFAPAAELAREADQLDPVVVRGRLVLHELTGRLRRFAREQWAADRPPRRVELVLSRGVRSQAGWEEVEETALEADLALELLANRLTSLAETIGGLGPVAERSRTLAIEVGRLRIAAEQARAMLRRTALEPAPTEVVWLVVGDGELRLNMAPLDVASQLDESLFLSRESVLATSATLQTQGSFSHSTERLGLAEAETLLVESPFDYRNAVLTLLVDDLPDPDRPGHAAALHELIAETTLAAGGRTLVLFTSHRAVRAAAQELHDDLDPREIRVLAQRLDGSPARLLRMLQDHPQSLLLGTAAFWEGVDVPGDALSQIVVARLPFPVPTDPVTAGRAEQYADPFGGYLLPQAMLRFRQGFGRLIRRMTDRGVFVVADSRMAHRRYGAAFREVLPETEWRRLGADEVAQATSRWLQR